MATASPAAVISGTARWSLGAEIASRWSVADPRQPIVAVDRRDNCDLARLSNVVQVSCDLNSFSQGYGHSAATLTRQLMRQCQQNDWPGIGILVCSAGVFDSGALSSTGCGMQEQLLGINVCGKVELIAAVLETNRALGFPSHDRMTLLDVGSLHGLGAAPGRALYSATKAFGLDMCLALGRGAEIARAIHVAPGPIDTPMLHRNHWVIKANGPEDLFECVLRQHADDYMDIFMGANVTPLYRIGRGLGHSSHVVKSAYESYIAHRRAALSDRNGILPAAILADYIVQLLGRSAPGAGPEIYAVSHTSTGVSSQSLPLSRVLRL